MIKQICCSVVVAFVLVACNNNKTVSTPDTVSPRIASKLRTLDWVLDVDVVSAGAFVNVAIGNPNHAEFLTRSMCAIANDYRTGKFSTASAWYNGKRIGKRNCVTWIYKQN